MKIRFRKTTHIHLNSRATEQEPLGQIFEGVELELDGTIHEGTAIEGDNRWLRDQNGWFYWAGATEPLSNFSFEASLESTHTALHIPPVAAENPVALPASSEQKSNLLAAPEGEWTPDIPASAPAIKPRTVTQALGNTGNGTIPLTPLQQIIQKGRNITTDELNAPAYRSAALELQTRLCDLGLLDPEISGDVSTPFGPISKGDGILGTNSRAAIAEFCRLTKQPFVNKLLTVKTLQKIIAANPETFLPIKFGNASDDTQSTRLLKRILRYMRNQGYWIARSPRMRNIVYVEGMDANGIINKDEANQWNDRRIVFRIAPNGVPEMLVNDQSTTEPGKYYTWNPLNPNGAARIAFGQYKAWVVGLHNNKQPALVQRENVRLHRDLNKDGFRSASDPIDIGKTFGINQHSTKPGAPPEWVNSYSAGCLVGRRWAWHLAFLNIVKQDERYRQNQGYLFISTIISGDELAKEEPF